MLHRATTAFRHAKRALVEGMEFRTRLVNIEELADRIERKVDRSLDGEELRTRLVNIEALVDCIERRTDPSRGDPAAQPQTPSARSADPFRGFSGSSDQGFGHLTYAQFGEDLMVANIFALLGVDRPGYLDVGGNHPVSGSNTALLYARGSRGVVVEANPNYMPLWRETRPEDTVLNIGVALEAGEMPFHFVDGWSGRNTFDKGYADAFTAAHPDFKVEKVTTIRTVTINEIVEKHTGGRWPDFLSLDIEGLDYAVLESADFSASHPRVICLETRDGAGKDISAPFLALLPKRGFRPVFRTWGNMIAVHESAMPGLDLEPRVT